MARIKPHDTDGDLFRQAVEKKLDIRQKSWGVRVVYGRKSRDEYCDVGVGDYEGMLGTLDRLEATREAVTEALFELNKIEQDVDSEF